MIKWILTIGALCVSAAAFMFWQSNQEESSDTNSSLLAFVPADTIYFLGGEGTKELTDFFRSMPMGATMPSQNAQLSTLMDIWKTNESKPGKFFTYLGNKVSRAESGSLGDLVDLIGLSDTGAFTIYSHGIAPVARFEIKSSDTILKLVDEAVAASDWQYQEEIIESTTIRLWEISKEGAEITLYFVLSTSKNTATLTFISSADNDNTKWERLGLTKPAHSLLDSKEIEALNARYGFNEYMTGFVHFERLANGFLNPEKNLFGQQFQQYLPESAKADLDAKLSAECRTDFAALASGMPRAVIGYEDMSLEDDSLHMTLNTILEISNASITQELGKMRGHIPAHALNSTGKIANFGVGLSVDQLTPALTNLWTQFVNADFSCDTLQKAQDSARQTSPAMLGMFLGMVNGVEGFGVSLFDITWGEGSTTPENVSALISISAQNPETLASMSAMIPMLAGLQIPTDGSAVDIPLPLGPTSFSVKAAIKGKHIVIYSGDKLEAQLSALKKEELTPNGIYSVGLNYRRFNELTQMNLGGMGGSAVCIAQQEFTHIFSQMPMDLSYVLDASQNGIEGKIDVTMEKSKQTTLSFGGKYSVDFLNDNCQWESTGTEEVKADNTGRYVDQDENKECDTHISEYKWEQKNDSILFTPTKELSRENCSDKLKEQELLDYSCSLLNIKQSTFQCLFDAGTPDAALYRYTAQ